MSGVEAIALTDFVHGDITALEGRLVRHRDGSLIRQALARDLEKHGLIRVRMDPPKPAAPVAQGKAQDDGQGRPSSASPAAQASTTTTSDASSGGGRRGRRGGGSSSST